MRSQAQRARDRAVPVHRGDQLADAVNQDVAVKDGGQALSLGDYPTAQRQFMQALALSAAMGQRKNEGIIHINLALVMLNLEQPSAAQAEARQALELLRAVGDRWGEAAALRVAGQAAQALGDTRAAAALFIASRALFDALEMPHLAIEAIAALAAAALARGDLDGALGEVQAILDRQAAGANLEGTDEPLRIRLVCWQVLSAAEDPRAADALATAWRELSASAERIGDVLRRQTCLEAVPFHRAIVQAWRAAQAAGGAG